MPRVTKEQIDRAKSASLYDQVSRSVKLKAKGKNGTSWMGLCPFHNEKTPSFHVQTKFNSQFYHCFGCAKSGDVIKWVMERENMTFPEAVEKLSRQ